MRQSPKLCERGGEGLALVVAASCTPFGAQRNRYEHGVGWRPLDQLGHDSGHVARHARQTIVFQGMDGAARAAVEPNRRARRRELGGPWATQSAGTKMGLRLPATLTPGWTHRSPAQATHAADEIVAELGTEEPVAHQTLGGQEELLDTLSDTLEIQGLLWRFNRCRPCVVPRVNSRLGASATRLEKTRLFPLPFMARRVAPRLQSRNRRARPYSFGIARSGCLNG